MCLSVILLSILMISVMSCILLPNEGLSNAWILDANCGYNSDNRVWNYYYYHNKKRDQWDKRATVIISHTNIKPKATTLFRDYGTFTISDESDDIKITQSVDTILLQYKSGQSSIQIKNSDAKRAFIIENGAYSSGELRVMSAVGRVDDKIRIFHARDIALRMHHNLKKEDLILEILRGRDNIKVINYYYAYPD
ncbi:hypothetical protein CR532_04570 (plasmid) [Candidatus Borreliella tachyglossi]|uniref:Uncharacterized protein n=1 Tax=Candidatus Borreliella tachyglossi TaxID=1964448 RepID=A0A2S1LY96_9SPIR|nr:hypothetical protein CR532_04570 [Candidatus Borreliella tachyglossi]